jgi:hypothetical protein
MNQVGFKPTISVFEQIKRVHALDITATVIGKDIVYKLTNSELFFNSCKFIHKGKK